jgi:DNA-binding transcriptional MerR regulator
MELNEVDQTGDEYMTIKGACDRLGVSPNTLRSWGASGKVTEYRHPMNNYRLYRRADIEALRTQLLNPRPSTGNKNE